ncbi:hypothetical protein M436DRAFT_66820 [Aureobasidium namibiae CBS 147.97]|uniref:Uncharacterized protein n=1 Tax=Aureobasidium namibiae CBS 147.97 TaxID=1043004 RepID=A0A074X5V5_9PEZI
MAKGKRKSEAEEDEKDEKKNSKKARLSYDFFHDKPESAKRDAPTVLVCRGEKCHVFPQILEISSKTFSQRWEHIVQNNRTYAVLDSLAIRGVQVYANWAMDHEKPALVAINDDGGDILDDLITCYLTARALRAYLLCDLLLYEACKVGSTAGINLVVRRTHITKVYEETKRSSDALRNFLAAVVAYQRRNSLANPISGKDERIDKQRSRFEALPQDFQFDLMDELSKNNAAENPCQRPKRFLKVVIYHMEKKEEKRAAAVRARLEARGSEGSPLFVDGEDD